MPPAPYNRPPSKSVLPPLIPTEDEYDKQEEGLFSSMGRLFFYTGSSIAEIFGGLFSRKKPIINHMQQQQQQHRHYPPRHSNPWPAQESFVIPHEDGPPPPETRDHTPRKGYPLTNKDMQKSRQFNQSRSYYTSGGWNNGDYPQQQLQHHQHHQKHHPSSPQTHYEQQNCETNEIIFGAVQEQDGKREAMVIKSLDYGEPVYNNHNVRSRYNYMSYSYGY